MRPQTLAGLLGMMALAAACVKVPFTGRHQYNLIPDSAMRALGKTSYSLMLSDVKVKSKGKDNKVLQKVGGKISRSADQPKYNWEYSMISEDTVNAWCLPGGYIGFYTGILPALQNEAGMAFVMGHEVGHATAHHGAERLSQQITLVGGLIGGELWLKGHTKLKPAERQVVLGALGAGATVGILLPFSRMHESEADVIGMMYMSKAGYPPAESIKVWDRMAAETAGGVQIPAFLSTHPSNAKRQKNQREWLPTARKRYERNKLPYNTKEVLWGGTSANPPEPSTVTGPRRGASSSVSPKR